MRPIGEYIRLYGNNFWFVSAPDKMTLKGNFTVLEGTLNTYFCKYKNSQPSGNSSIYYINHIGELLVKVHSLFGWEIKNSYKG